MNKLFKKKYLLIITAVILLTLVVGCSNDGELIDDEVEYDLTIGVALDEVEGESIESITDQIEADRVEATVTNVGDSSESYSDDSSMGEDAISFEFPNLTNEESYQIDIDIYEEDKESEEEFKIYQGSDEVLIDGKDITAPIEVELTEAEAVVFSLENLPPLPPEADNGIIAFVPKNQYDIEEEINFSEDESEGEVIVEDLAANHYHFTILFTDEAGNAIELENEWEIDDKEFYAYPGERTTVVELDFGYDEDDPKEGSLDIDIGWDLPPKVPETINAESDGEAVELSWEDTSDFYFIYKGQSADELSPIQRDTISENEYIDNDVETGETYYYSLRAYDENNLASSESDVIDIVVDEDDGDDDEDEEDDYDGVRIYHKSDSAPNIWAWEANDGVAISEEMGYEWNNQPEMEATEDDGWYVFEIPGEGQNDDGEEIEFLTGEDLNVIFDEGDELQVEPETAWYDGEWHDENPDGPTKPSIAITPGEGSYAGDTEISVEINDDDINNIEFAGQEVTNYFVLEDYLADGEQGELVVEAENDIGRREVRKEYIRDDEAGDLPKIPESEVNETMYQAFYWEAYEGLWSDIAEAEYENVDAERLAEAGITTMWLPPAAKAGEGEESMGYDVYDFWDLGEFDQQGAQNTHWGTREELDSALEQLDDLGIDAYFDVVFNHRMGGEIEEVPLNDGGTAHPYTDMTLEGRAQHYSNADEFDWNWEEFNGADWCSESDAHPDGAEDRGGFIDPNWDDTDDEGNPQSGNEVLFQGKDWEYNNVYSNPYLMGNDVDYAQERVRNEMNEWGEWVTDEVGFAGFRMDAIAHVPDYFTDQWIDYVQDNTEDDIFFVAEAWVGDVGGYLDSVGNDDLMAFDFALRDDFAELRDGNKDLSDWGGIINSHHADQAVTFLDNHDTSRAGGDYGHEPINRFKSQSYAYILTREEGIPTVYARDYDEFGYDEQLDTLIEARRYFAYGEGHEVDNNDYHTYSYVREGLDDVDGTGLVMMISDSESGGTTTKEINSRQPNTEFYDYTGNIDDTVTTDSNGNGDFQVREEESSGWSIWVPKN